MNFTNSIKYILSCMLIYLSIFLLELFLLNPLLDGISENYIIRIIIYAFLMLIINPIITFYIGERLPFNPEGLKVPHGLEGALKHKIEIFDEDE